MKRTRTPEEIQSVIDFDFSEYGRSPGFSNGRWLGPYLVVCIVIAMIAAGIIWGMCGY